MKTEKTAAATLATNVIGKARKKGTGAPVIHLADPSKSMKAPSKDKKKAPSLGMIVRADGDLAYSGKAWTPAARALVATVHECGRITDGAGEKAVGALCDLFAMGTAKALGFDSDAELGRAVVKAFNLPGAVSTMYGWVSTATAKAACKAGNVPTDALGSDALRLVAQHGKEDPALMARVARSMVDEPSIRSASGRVDVKKARAWFEGEGAAASGKGPMDRGEKIAKIAKLARRLGGTRTTR